MDDSRILRGIELRYALTMYLVQHGPCSIATLIEALTFQGFVIGGHPPKSVSDALRWEMGHCRVCRVGRGRYAPFEIPRSTEYRIHQRVMALRTQARRIRSEAGTLDGAAGPREAQAAPSIEASSPGRNRRSTGSSSNSGWATTTER